MLLGYNTNGLAHHRLEDAIRLLAEIGYESVAITVDHHALNPYAPELNDQLATVGKLLASCGMRSVIETGARFLLNPNVKHEPTLLTVDDVQRGRRIDFLQRCVDIAAALESDCVSLWSGVLHQDEPDDVVLDRLASGLGEIAEYADRRDMMLAFEPEPGMYIDTMAHFQRMLQWIDSPRLQLTMDVGHLHCLGETPIADRLNEWSDRIANVHIEDMRGGVHDHLMFGEGEMEFQPIIDALARNGYRGGLHVELSRHSHQAPEAARRSFEFLRPMIDSALA